MSRKPAEYDVLEEKLQKHAFFESTFDDLIADKVLFLML